MNICPLCKDFDVVLTDMRGYGDSEQLHLDEIEPFLTPTMLLNSKKACASAKINNETIIIFTKGTFCDSLNGLERDSKREKREDEIVSALVNTLKTILLISQVNTN